MSGKGSGRRPTQIKDEQFEDNWSRIFGNKPDHLNYLLKDDKDGFSEEANKENKNTTDEKR